MVMPSQPVTFFSRPFASQGTYKIIPETGGDHGRASLAQGFPPETQLPLAMGGVAPNRMDFNGILYMLSNMAFWEQSGGQWTYNATLNYAPPCIVYHDKMLWWCAAPNGPDAGTRIAAPGANSAYWISLLEYLLKAGVAPGGDDSGPGVVPQGAILLWSGAAAAIPSGWALCNGQNGTPDLRDRFVVGAGSSYAVKATGGAATHTHTGSTANVNATGAIGQTTLTSGQTPTHKHVLYGGGGGGPAGQTTHVMLGYAQYIAGFKDSDGPGTPSKTVYHGVTLRDCRPWGAAYGTGYDMSAAMENASGTGTPHTHSFTPTAHSHTVTVGESNHRPPYFALCYIMKL